MKEYFYKNKISKTLNKINDCQKKKIYYKNIRFL
jgi:hypothetical protein